MSASQWNPNDGEDAIPVHLDRHGDGYQESNEDPTGSLLTQLTADVVAGSWEQVLGVDLPRLRSYIIVNDRTRQDEGLLFATVRASLGRCLVAASYNPSVPVKLFECLLRIDPQIALFQDDAQNSLRRTALHLIVSLHDRPDLVSCMVEASFQAVRVRDGEGLRPIDVLTTKILMKEERLTYRARQQRRQQQQQTSSCAAARDDDLQVLEDNWECARLLVNAHAQLLNNTNSTSSANRRNQRHYNNLPIVHACLRAADIPVALREGAIRKYSAQLRQADSNGNLPLHHIASRRPPSDDDDDDDVLPQILFSFPEAARIQNVDGQWPVDVAIRAGRRWHSGISILLYSYPQALLNLEQHCYHLPLILQELQQREREYDNHDRPSSLMTTAIVFALLRANPEVVPAYSTTSPL